LVPPAFSTIPNFIFFDNIVLNTGPAPPSVLPATATVSMGGILHVAGANGVLLGDTPQPLTVSAVEGSAANVGKYVMGTYGWLQLRGGGGYDYVETLPTVPNVPGSGADDIFHFTVKDSHGNTVDTTLDIALTASSDSLTFLEQTAEAYINAQVLSDVRQHGVVTDPQSYHFTDDQNHGLMEQLVENVAAKFGTPPTGYVFGDATNTNNYSANNNGYTSGFLNLVSDLQTDNNFQYLDQCVGLVKCLDPGVGASSTWHPNLSEKIKLQGSSNLSLPEGPLPIATFVLKAGGDPNNPLDWVYGGGHHAEFFLGYGTENGQAGFFVLDQYNLPNPLPPANTPGSSHLWLLPDGTTPSGGHYEHVEVRFIGFNDPHAKEYYVI
jgi:hypothetical protein